MLKTTCVVASILMMTSSIFAVDLPVKAAPCSSATLTNSLFLKIEGIPGDSRDKCHPNEIEPLSFQNSGTSFTVVKKIDASSPKLFIEGLAGTHINEAILTVFQAGTPSRLILYKMKNVIIASIDQVAGSANRETVTLRFQRMETEILSTSGSARSAAAPAGVDVTFTVGNVQSGASMVSDGFSTGQLRDFVLNKRIDAVSPTLMQASVSGQHLAEVDITLKQRGTSDILVYKLTDVVVAGDMQQSSAMEQVRLKPSKFTMQYQSTSGSGTRSGTGTPPPAQGWDVKAAKKV